MLLVGKRREIKRLIAAAESGDTHAMVDLAALLKEVGDSKGAETWLRRGADAGNAACMNRLGNLLDYENRLDEAEHWFRRATEAGDARSGYPLAYLLDKRGDVGGAEVYYRRAADTGDAASMGALGAFLYEKGDPEGAEVWLRRGADSGDGEAMRNLGVLLSRRGDLEAAEALYRRSVSAGSAKAMENLAYLLKQQGDRRGAESWYRRAADEGRASAMSNVGTLRWEDGDAREAEIWYRRALEHGDPTGCIGLGNVFETAGDLNGAEEWYQKAHEMGERVAPTCLERVRSKIWAEEHLDDVTFDTFGWEPSEREAGVRGWHAEGASVTEHFFLVPAHFDTLDAESIREELMGLLDAVESPTFSIQDLELPGQMAWAVPKDLPDQILLLDVECFEVPPAQCVVATQRSRRNGEVHYGLMVFILFAECFWTVTLEVEEGDDVGEREGAVAACILNGSTALNSPFDTFDPYDRKWDGIVPVEKDPLTRLRLLGARLRGSITLSPRTRELQPFQPTEE